MSQSNGSEPVTEPLTVADIVALLQAAAPPELAEDWDSNGLICGDPAEPVRTVLLAVDPLTEPVEKPAEKPAEKPTESAEKRPPGRSEAGPGQKEEQK